MKAVFATGDQTADILLISRIQKVEDPSAYTVVTSDREILAAARKRRMPFMTSEAFAQQLEKVAVDQATKEIPDSSIDEEPSLSEAEIEEWMAIFEEEPEPQSTSDLIVRESLREEKDQEKITESPEPNLPEGEPTVLKSGSRKLSSDEVDEWLTLFQDGGENQIAEGSDPEVK
jgi:hypothetical protein